MATTQPIRKKQQIKELAEYFLKLGQIRNYVLVILGVHTALRISDLLRLRWEDVYDFDNRRVRPQIFITEKKTGKSKIVALGRSAVKALERYAKWNTGGKAGRSRGGLEVRRGGYIIENLRTGQPISRIQAYRIIRAASEHLHFQVRATCHSLRKTFGYHAWQCGISPAVIMEIYNHSSLAVTRRYLGITQDDKNAAYLLVDFSVT